MRVRLLIGALAVVAVLVVVAVVVVLNTTASGHRLSFTDGASAGIEDQLRSQGGGPAPVTQGGAAGHLTLAGHAGQRVAVAVICHGGGLLKLTLNGAPIGQVNCQSTYDNMIIAGFSLSAPFDSTVIGLDPLKGQHWWAAISGPGGSSI